MYRKLRSSALLLIQLSEEGNMEPPRIGRGPLTEEKPAERFETIETHAPTTFFGYGHDYGPGAPTAPLTPLALERFIHPVALG